MEKALSKEAVNPEKVLRLLGPLLFAGNILFTLLSDVTYPVSTKISDRLNEAAISMKRSFLKASK